MTGVGNEPRDLSEFIVDTRRRIVSLERRRIPDGGITPPSPPPLPAGSMTAFAGAVAPTGWFLCEGLPYDPVLYPALFAVIGNSWGGTPSAPLLPDLRGRTVIGRDASQAEFDVLGEAGGAKTHRHDFRFAMIDRNWTVAGDNAAMGGVGGANSAGAYRYSTGAYQGASGAGGVTANVNSSVNSGSVVTGISTTRQASTGDTDLGSSLPPYRVVNWIIATGA